MLIEIHGNPGSMSPDDFAATVADSGLDAVVITRKNSVEGLDAYASALDAEDIDAFVGVELTLDRGSVVFIPSDPATLTEGNWAADGDHWSLDALNARCADLDGALVAAHPYFRSDEPAMGDRVYRINGLSGVVTRIGRGRSNWDRLADQAAAKRRGGRLASAGGALEHLGCAATVVPDTVDTQADLVRALRDGACLPVELDDPAQPRDREPPRPISRVQRDDGDGRRGGRRDDRRGGRGRRDDRRGPRRGPRRD